jgi:hypothetical protein
MRSILNDLHSPDWWFTALVMGIFASLVAAYVKDGVPVLVSGVSRRLSHRRRRNLRSYAWSNRLVLREPVLLAFYGIDALVHIVAVFFALLMGFIASTTGLVLEHVPAKSPDHSPVLMSALCLLGMILSAWVSWRVPRRVLRFYLASVVLRRKALRAELGQRR